MGVWLISPLPPPSPYPPAQVLADHRWRRLLPALCRARLRRLQRRPGEPGEPSFCHLARGRRKKTRHSLNKSSVLAVAPRYATVHHLPDHLRHWRPPRHGPVPGEPLVPSTTAFGCRLNGADGARCTGINIPKAAGVQGVCYRGNQGGDGGVAFLCSFCHVRSAC